LTTFDTDVAIKATNNREIATHLFEKSLNNVKGSYWGSHSMSFSSPMSACSVAAAASTLRRAGNVGHVSGGGKEGEGELAFNEIILVAAFLTSTCYRQRPNSFKRSSTASRYSPSHERGDVGSSNWFKRCLPWL
jgi:hypothetical protein